MPTNARYYMSRVIKIGQLDNNDNKGSSLWLT